MTTRGKKQQAKPEGQLRYGIRSDNWSSMWAVFPAPGLPPARPESRSFPDWDLSKDFFGLAKITLEVFLSISARKSRGTPVSPPNAST